MAHGRQCSRPAAQSVFRVEQVSVRRTSVSPRHWHKQAVEAGRQASRALVEPGQQAARAVARAALPSRLSPTGRSRAAGASVSRVGHQTAAHGCCGGPARLPRALRQGAGKPAAGLV